MRAIEMEDQKSELLSRLSRTAQARDPRAALVDSPRSAFRSIDRLLVQPWADPETPPPTSSSRVAFVAVARVVRKARAFDARPEDALNGNSVSYVSLEAPRMKR